MLGRALAAVGALALLLAGALLVWSYSALWRPVSSREVAITVAEGAPAGEVLADLHRAGLLPSPVAGRLYLRAFASGRSPRWGHYRFPAGSRPADALERVLEGRVETVAVTIVEGWGVEEVAAACAAAGVGTVDEWRAIARRRELIADLAPAAPSLEGFLFPDTFRFAVGLAVPSAADHMLDRFREVWRAETAAEGELWASPLELVTLASLVEAETSVAEERPLVAGVYRNRLARGMLLQCDPTVVYALKRRGEWQGRLLLRHLATDDPYNTYRYPGLPPGPINSPGRAALAAALRPASHDLLYFVASPGGGHSFSRTLAEHERAVAHWRASRR
ncbi:MAG TPA: endolytic transglycosylase MltG [Thermoanaerobaculales bacterium]|nr:endolytic transglycosylase MltG [Thermoanaerobaculales bacterium]HPA81819.1 endolytic transglycosylase MltG [Thermoanaerobaculales bacterium]HQL28580.1 endolytic transglycosylase MltG [Thermoanaerobaculales bacterium]HQN95784.1 endolytic transglycosylase MltG [Thermoanaerobaculales bacterium]HQP44481.1 endolytic transglycosylase MltG [Thermoanaerobaculales bacterium]